MVVGVRQADLKVLETADLLSFPTTSISEVYREWSKKEKNIQRVPVLWVKISFWCQALEENGKIVTEITTLQSRYAEGHLWTHITLSLGLQQHKTIPGISAVYDVTDPRVEKECLKKTIKSGCSHCDTTHRFVKSCFEATSWMFALLPAWCFETRCGKWGMDLTVKMPLMSTPWIILNSDT